MALDPRTDRSINWSALRRTGAVVVALIVAFATGLAMGWVQEGYESLWMATADRPYTHIMRDNPWVFPAAASVLITQVSTLLPRNYSARLVIVIVTFATGFLGGHVFWS